MAALQEPTPQQVDALQLVWDLFRSPARWPTYATVDRAVYRAVDDDLPSLLGGAAPAFVLLDPHGHPTSQVCLTLAGIVRCGRTSDEVAHLLAAVRWCVQRERTYEPAPDAIGEELRISSDELLAALGEMDRPPSRAVLNRVFAMLVSEGVTSGSNGPNPDAPDVWSFTLDRRVRRFKDVQTLEHLLQAVDRSSPAATLPAATPAPAAQPGRAPAEPAPRVFVLMPFHEPWSQGVYDAVRRGCRLAGAPELTVTRADELTLTGSITEQILQSIIDADIIVADVTGTNANVMYELGYADALDKPAVLLNQEVGASPFDIRILRQIEYACDALDELSASVARFVATALERNGRATPEPRQPAALAPAVLRPWTELRTGPFNMPLSGQMNCWLLNEGPGTVVIDGVRLHHAGAVVHGHPCASNGQALQSLAVPIGNEALVQIPASLHTAALRADRRATPELSVRFRDPLSRERWWISFTLRRATDTGSRAQWSAVAQSDPQPHHERTVLQTDA